MMTPMVDVVLVILIFFMASTTIAGQEWFLRAGVETVDGDGSSETEARFALPEAVIEVDLVRGTDGVTMVYGIGGTGGVRLERAVELIRAMDGTMTGGDVGSLKVGLGAGDDVPMGDVMMVHDAWNGLGGDGGDGLRVVMRTGR